MKSAYDKVRQYHEVFGHRAPPAPTSLPQDRVIHRAGFMAEELAEFLKAAPDDLVAQSDALIDLIYFALGTFVEMGVDPAPLFDAVHQANMDKLWDGEPKYNPANGKTLKPPGWVGPEARLEALIAGQMAEAREPAKGDRLVRTKPNVKQVVPFFAVADIEVSARYYVDGLGFEMTQKWVDGGQLRWCWLQLEGASLMLQQFAIEGQDAWVPEGKVGEGVSLNFICEDAIALYHAFKVRGIDVKTPFVGNGMWVTGLTDPDGYKLFFESETDVPEETVYVEPEG